jgi:hypothetical protein
MSKQTEFVIDIPAYESLSDEQKAEAEHGYPISFPTFEDALAFARAMAPKQSSERGRPSQPAPSASPLMGLLAGELAEGLVTLGEQRPELVQRLAGVLGRAAPPSAPGALLMTKEEYAERIAFSVRKLDQFTAAGLPTFGKGRSRRIKVREADAWLLAHSEGDGSPPDDVALDALAAAKRRSKTRGGRRGR